MTHQLRRSKGTGSVIRRNGKYVANLSRVPGGARRPSLGSFDTDREASAALDEHYKDKLSMKPIHDLRQAKQWSIWLSKNLLDRAKGLDLGEFTREALHEKLERTGR